MRPPSHFGNDITNRATAPNDNNNNNNNNSNNNNNNSADDGRDLNGNSGGGRLPPANIVQMGGRMIISQMAGRGIIRVVERCEDAKENNKLDLSECQLMQVPDAVYHLMRNTELKSCDLSRNDIKKIPPKFAIKFSLITELNLSQNLMSKLPDELADLASLQRLNISHNSFITMPNVVFKMPKLRHLIANDNAIIEVDTDEIIVSDSLELVDLRNNPLTPRAHEWLKSVKLSFHIELSERKKESWEDF